MTLQTKVYDSALRSRLEPSKEQLSQAKEFRDAQRRNGYLIVYSMAKNVADLVSMTEGVMKREGIQQKRLSAEDKATFSRLRDVFSMQAERAWLRQGLAKAGPQPLAVFEEVLRVFPGSRLVERRQGNFVKENAS